MVKLVQQNQVILPEFSTDQPKPTGEHTTAKAEVNVATLGTSVEDIEVDNFKKINESVLKQLIADKKELFFDGDNNIKGENDIESARLEDVTSEKTKLKLKVKLKAEKWYDTDKSLGKQSKEFEIMLTGFKAPDSSSPGGKNK